MPTSPPGAAALRVLLVDDCADNVLSLSMILRDWGHEVVSADGADTALALAAQRQPHVAVLDIGLPGMTGWDLCRRLRLLPGLAELPAIAITGYDTPDDRRRSSDLGFLKHLVKPFDLVELNALLADLARVPRS